MTTIASKKRFNHRNTAFRQRGVSLPQVLIAGAVGTAILLAGIAGGPKAMGMYRSSGEINDLPTIFNNIQGIYRQYPSYASLTMDTVVRSNAFPQNMSTIPAVGTPATATNRWGGAYTIALGTITTTNDIARLVSNGVPNAECQSVVQGVAASARRVYVDSTNSGTAGAGTQVKTDGGTLDSALLSTACGTTNSITFDISK